jgi:hypothetical protein
VGTLSQVRAALADTIGNVPGLRASPQFTAVVSPPCAVVLPAPEFIHYGETSDGALEYMFEVILLVSESDDRAAQNLLDGYLSAGGPASVPAAILADPSLDGTADYCVVTRALRYGFLDWAGVSYLSARLMITAGTM